MRWPDMFFKPRKSKTLPSIVTVPAKAAEPDRPSAEKTPADRAEAVRNDAEKTESLRALADSGSVVLPRRAEKDSPIASPAPVEPDSSNAKTAVLPAVPARAGAMSLRQRAKLTDDARSLPKQDAPEISIPAEPSKPPEPARTLDPVETKSDPAPDQAAAAVVPAAFTVSVETGSVMDKAAQKIDEKKEDEPRIETEVLKPVEGKDLVEKAAPDLSPSRAESPDPAPSPRDTMRVHIAHTTTSGEPSKELEPAKVDTREKSEFVLANGERIYGHVLSETPQTIYLDHGTLGVLTLPRSQIATKPIEVILINGDRIVGDLIAETPECLYIKHASLGMLTVPHGQRSTRVVEAILKDGDRILGEVLAETDNFTVIRSATLGTVAVQHEQVAMLNRKIEQMQLRALPTGSTPTLENKKD